MQQRFDVELDNVSMASLADEIIVRDIIEEPANMRIDTVLRGNRPGTRVEQNIRQSLSVRVVYRIRTQNIVRRAEVRDVIAAWCANGGELNINTRPGKRLFVIPTSLPAVNSGLKWDQDLALVFTAYEQPYWEDKSVTSVGGTVKKYDDGSHYFADVIRPVCSVDRVPVTANITITGEDDLAELRIKCGDTVFEFVGMQISSGGYISISYDKNDLLSVVDFMSLEGDGSLLKYRTAQSNDDLLAVSNQDNQIIITANTELRVQVHARGRWV